MSRIRLPMRLARREVLRRPGRTILVALLVALPVAGMVLAIVLIRTDAETQLEQWQRSFGDADATGFGTDLARDWLPAGSRVVPVQSTDARIKAADGTRAWVHFSDLPLEDPITTGIHDLVTGRAPERPGEVVLSAQLADQLGVEVGDEVVLERPALRATLVGEVEPVGCLSCGTALFAPGGLPRAVGDLVEYAGLPLVLIDLPAGLSVEELVALQNVPEGGLAVRDIQILPEYAYSPDAERGQAVRWSLVIGALVLTVVGIVISAAFAIGARRQLVTIGQLSASGASPATVRTGLVLQGTVTGVVGAVAGLAIAATVLFVGQPFVERVLDQRIHGYVARPLELVAVLLIGVGAATIAAVIPARTAAQVPTLAALAGRRPLAPVSRRLIAWGVVSTIGGLALLFIAVVGSRSGSSGDLWAFVAIGGGIAQLLGACAIAPVLVARLEPLANRLHGGLRLGARSLARHRARTGAVVSAVAAAGALAVAAGGLMLGTEAQYRIDSEIPDDLLVVQTYDDTGTAADQQLPADLHAELVSLLPDAREIPTRSVLDPAVDVEGSGFWSAVPAAGSSAKGFPQVAGSSWDGALLADDALLGALRVGDDVREALDRTGIVVLTTGDDGSGLEGAVTVTLPSGRTAAGVAVPHRFIPGYLSTVLVSEQAVHDLDLEVRPVAVMFESPEALTEAQRAVLEDIQYDAQDPLVAGEGVVSRPTMSFQWEYPQAGPTPFQLELILSGLALVFSLFVVGVSLALAAAESKDERDILTVAGAPPATLARSAGAKAWLLAVLGSALAVPVGFLPVVVFANAQNRHPIGDGVELFPVVFPTRTVLLLVVVVPLSVALVSWMSSAMAQRFRPVRVSTATFE